MNYVRQLNAFGEKSIGVLNAKEQAMYLRLFLIHNALRRPEWFTVSNTQLMRELDIKSEHTVIKLREQLRQKGFLIFRSTGQGKMIAYHMPILYSDTPAKNAVVDAGTPAKNAGDPCKKCSGTPAKNADIIKDKDIKNISSTTAPPQDENFRQAVEVYEKSIRPVPSPADLERLSDCLDHYGKDALLKAIDRADYRGRRSMGYIEGILQSWEQNGYDDPEGEHGHGKADGPRPAKTAGRHRKKALRFDPEAERRKWANEKSGWD